MAERSAKRVARTPAFDAPSPAVSEPVAVRETQAPAPSSAAAPELPAMEDRPLLPAALTRFPDGAGTGHAALHRALADALIGLKQQTERNPFSNPIQLLALDTLQKLAAGELGHGAVEQLIQRLTGLAFFGRARRHARALGERDPEANRAGIKALIRRLAGVDEGRTTPLPFARFKAAVEREAFGIVFTAHPTFALSADLLDALAELAMDRDGTGAALTPAARQAVQRRASSVEHRPDKALDLAVEHALSVAVIRHARAALRQVYEIVFDVAAELYPTEWTALSPRLVTLASWVGYDLDGRSDIKWSDSLFKRLKLQAEQLAYYRDATRAIRLRGAGAADVELRHTLELIESRLSLAIKEAADEIEVFQDSGGAQEDWHERVRRIARRMHDGKPLRLVESAPLVELVERAMTLAHDDATRRALAVLRAEIVNHGLGMAHTHVRLNATQLHNAIRKSIGMEGPPDDPARRRSYVSAVSELIARVEPVRINFGSILAERASAKRLFMLVAQMVKYVDATTPVRFLIAECETAFTLLAALYYAKLFDVEDRLDISPLFETAKAFERGITVIEDCLNNPHYVAYVRRRGRLCVQTGFSDAGRGMGQIAAAVAVERLRLRLAALLAERGLTDIEVVIFDTHGESIGRGGHPSSFADRLAYVASPASRQAFARAGIACKEEASFQGGDGFVNFLTPPIAFTSLCRILEFALQPPAEEADADPFYDDSDYATEFFIAIRQFNERLMTDPDYAALLDAYGANMLYPSGSRALRREHDIGGARVDLTDSWQIRAIPHNAILQQLGLLAIPLAGVGHATAKDPERFQKLYRCSPRFRRLFAMVEWALEFSDFDVLKAYVDTLDPGLWLLQAAHHAAGGRIDEFRQVAGHLEATATHERLVRILRVLQKDHLDLTMALAGARGAVPPVAPAIDGIGPEARNNLHLLHALRVALIHRVFMLTTHIPDFSTQHGISPEQLMARLFHLDVEPAVQLLGRIFPKVEPLDFGGDFGEPATYVSDANQSYEQEHDRIFQPIARLYDLIRRVSAGVTHTIGAVG